MAEEQGPTTLGIGLLPIWDHSSGSQVVSKHCDWQTLLSITPSLTSQDAPAPDVQALGSRPGH